MVSVQKLGGVINKPSLFDVSEHQDGAIRILYQSRTCNNIMQGSGHIQYHCNDDEYRYRYKYDVGVSQMDFYLRVLMCICFCLRVQEDTRHDWVFKFNRIRLNM